MDGGGRLIRRRGGRRQLADQGRLQPVAAAVEYGIPVEPYVFVVDAAGDVAATFEVVVDEQELGAALQDVLTTATIS